MLENRMPAPRLCGKGVVVAATHSGAGKTTVTLGILAALKRRSMTVAPFKVGPDFIDPGHHAHIAGRASRNLDGWMLSRSYNEACFTRHRAGCDVALVEGVMGLFDGLSGKSEAGSTAQMAKWLNLPVLLVVNAASMARSAAALVQGFERFDPEVTFAGVVFNNLGSKRHLDFLKDAMAEYAPRMSCLGGLLRDDALCLPERHLGLTTTEDHPLSAQQIERLADAVEEGLDLDDLLRHLPPLSADSPDAAAFPRRRPDVRIAVARDAAFCFYYPDNLELLQAAGAEVVPFSPLTDGALPEDVDGIYLGGGYPELHARRLSQNARLRERIRRDGLNGMPIYGECGGFMYLCRELEDIEGRAHAMCGCFPFRAHMHSKLRKLGYREVTLTADTLLGEKNRVLRGHEFHYSDITGGYEGNGVATVYSTVNSRAGKAPSMEGYVLNRTLGSYVHLHFGSRPECAGAFADACRAYRREKTN